LHALISAVVGIAIIGLLNFGVSFALVVALRARDVAGGERKMPPGAVLRRRDRHGRGVRRHWQHGSGAGLSAHATV
jgi:site-specific recombinase